MKGTRLEILVIGLTLLVFSLSTSGQSGTLYHCVNSKGSIFLTDNVPTDPDFKCTFSTSYKDLTPQERAKEQREAEADRQRMRADTAKQEAQRRAEVEKQEEANRMASQVRQSQEESQKNLQRSRNQRADKLEADARERLRVVRDKGFNLPQANIDALEKAAAAKADQIRKGTDTPMTASEDAEFHRRQDIDSALQWHKLQNH